MKQETFAAARIRLLGALVAKGWIVSDFLLKVPHARSPEGTIALFFRPQAVFCAALDGTQSASSAAESSRSLSLDTRGLTVEYLIHTAIERCAAEHDERVPA